MVKVIFGEKGTGKTKTLLAKVDEAVNAEKGSVVFINNGKRHLYDLSYKVRLVDTSDFEIKDYSALYGLLCGVISSDFDISNIFIDSLTKIVKESDNEGLERFLQDVDALCDKFGVELLLTISASEESLPSLVKKYA
ncbi:MAG: ATP-binding protein [Clostridiaceae bacterium]|nr:ATP-binding protein [Clostridiaceae bacterium]